MTESDTVEEVVNLGNDIEKNVSLSADNIETSTDSSELLDAPTNDDVEHHGQLLPPLQADGVENDAHHGAGRVDPENRPAQSTPDVHQADGGVGPHNQQEDGAVVQHLEHPLALTVRQGVVQARKTPRRT